MINKPSKEELQEIQERKDFKYLSFILLLLIPCGVPGMWIMSIFDWEKIGIVVGSIVFVLLFITYMFNAKIARLTEEHKEILQKLQELKEKQNHE